MDRIQINITVNVCGNVGSTIIIGGAGNRAQVTTSTTLPELDDAISQALGAFFEAGASQSAEMWYNAVANRE